MTCLLKAETLRTKHVLPEFVQDWFPGSNALGYKKLLLILYIEHAQPSVKYIIRFSTSRFYLTEPKKGATRK